MHSGGELLCDFMVQESHCFSFLWFGHLSVDLVSVIPLFPAHVVELKQDASEPFAARPTKTVLLVVEHLDALPGFCCQAFKQIEPTYLVLVSDSDSDGWGASEGINSLLGVPLL